MDVLAWNVIAWISAFKNNRRVGLYCSDVSGAFDRVKKERLLEKMRAKGLHPSILKIVSSWLEEREFTVILDGVQSGWHELENLFTRALYGDHFYGIVSMKILSVPSVMQTLLK